MSDKAEALVGPIDVAAVLRTRGAQAERAVEAFLAAQGRVPARLLEAIRYSLLAGGKRVRPTLALEWHAAISGDAEPNASALSAAGAIELVHTFSLVHDDLPAMDDDDLRRGAPTNHRVFGEALAILAGDAMTMLAFQLVAERADAKHAARLVAELARAGGPAGMIGGQALDIANENVALDLERLRGLHAMKTGALLVAACRLGAIAADATDAQLAAATAFGERLGLAFQIMDDVLDCTATPEQMGKATKKDHGAGKNTYPRLLGIEASRAMAREQLADALAALEIVEDRGPPLAALARFVVERDR